MYQAPYASLSGHVASLSDGTAGVHETLIVMRQMVRAGRVNLAIRQAAASVIFTSAQRDELSEVDALFQFVRDHIRYTRDVHQVETLTTPEKTLQLRIGDCDDKAVLLGSLLESVGYPVRFVVAGYASGADFEHVFLQVFACGEWLDLDPTEPGGVGESPPDPLIVYIEDVR